MSQMSEHSSERAVLEHLIGFCNQKSRPVVRPRRSFRLPYPMSRIDQGAFQWPSGSGASYRVLQPKVTGTDPGRGLTSSVTKVAEPYQQNRRPYFFNLICPRGGWTSGECLRWSYLASYSRASSTGWSVLVLNIAIFRFQPMHYHVLTVTNPTGNLCWIWSRD